MKTIYEVRTEPTATGMVYRVDELVGNTGWQVFRARHRRIAELVKELLSLMKEIDEKMGVDEDGE